jgi:hypothetical protein
MFDGEEVGIQLLKFVAQKKNIFKIKTLSI